MTNDEFMRKYKLFQLHKWTILKQIKEHMYKEKIRELEQMRRVKGWLVFAVYSQMQKTILNRFSREKDIAGLEAKKFWIILKAAIRIRMRIKKTGDYPRAKRQLAMDPKSNFNHEMMETRY